MSIMPVVDQPQTVLFQMDPVKVEKEVLNLRGAGSFTLTEDIAAELKRINGTEEPIALLCYVTCEGLKVLDGDLTWIATLADVALAD